MINWLASPTCPEHLPGEKSSHIVLGCDPWSCTAPWFFWRSCIRPNGLQYQHERIHLRTQSRL